MKKKVLAFLMSATLTVSAFQTCAFAAGNVNALSDIGDILQISGKLDGGKQTYTVEIIDTVSSNTIFADQFETDADGSYTKNIYIMAQGVYNVNVTAADGTNDILKEIIFNTKASIDSAVSAISAASDKKAELITNTTVLLGTSMFKEVAQPSGTTDPVIVDEIAQFIANDIAANGNPADYKDLNQRIKNAVFVYLSNHSANAGELAANITAYGSETQLDLATPYYTNLTPAEQAAVQEAVIGDDYTKFDDLNKAFLKNVMLQNINKLRVEDVEAFNNYFISPLQFSAILYSGLPQTQKTYFNTQLVSKNFTTVSEIEIAIPTLLQQASQYIEKNNDSSTNDGVGGLGGSVVVDDKPGTSDTNESIKDEYKDNPIDPELEINKTDSTTPFTDLGNASWAKPYIEKLYTKGIVNGQTETLFKPNASISRQEFVKMIVTAFGLTQEDAECEFEDMSKSDWGYKYVATANKLGIVNGINSNKFGKNDKITREQMATIVVRALELKNIALTTNDEIVFDDAASVSDYAKDAVSKLASANIINGKGNNNFEPKNNTTRAEVSKVLCEIIDVLEGITK